MRAKTPEQVAQHAAERKWLVSILAGLAASFLAIAAATVLVDDREAAGHAFGHLMTGTVIGFLGIVTGWFWKPHPSRLSRLSRIAVFMGLMLLVAGLFIESLGAFGWRGELAVSDFLTLLHTVGGLVSMGGAAALSAGIPIALLSSGLRVRSPAARLLTLTAAGVVAVLLIFMFALAIGLAG